MTAEVKVEEKQVETEVVVAPAVVSEETTVKDVVEETEVKPVEETKVEEDESKPKGVEKSASFKEESDFFSDLKDSERKALSDFKSKLEEAIVENTLLKKKEIPVKEKKESPVKEKKEEVVAKQEAEVEKKQDVEEKEEKKPETEAVVTEEAKTEAAVSEEAKPEAIVTEEAKTEAVVTEKAKDEAVVSEEIPKEEVKADEADEAVVVKEEETKDEVKAETVEEKKPEAVVTEAESKAETIKEVEEDESVDKDIELWGVPLLPSKGAEGTDVILLKFLRARDFKVNEAFEMLKKTLKWRKEQKIDSILGEDFAEELVSASYANGVDRESRPVCYNVHSVFENTELYQATFGSETGREKFLRWRFQRMEKEIQMLNLKPGGVTSLLQIHDLKNTPLSTKDIWGTVKPAIEALQDNYPEFVHKNIFINVPFKHYALYALLSPFISQRTKSKNIITRQAKDATETLLKYIPAEELPVQYGGFKRDNDTEFSNEAITEVVLKPGSSEIIEIQAPESEGTLVWDIAVLGWEVNYKEEFVPTEGYTVIVQKGKKIESSEGTIRNSFKFSQSGKIVLTVDNVSGKKKRVFYRFKTKTETSS